MNQVISAIGLGFYWGIFALGLFITFRILDFPDMTVEGTFPLGACTCVAAITHGVSPVIATLLAFIVGLAAGFITSILATVGKIPVLLAGILVMTAAYSVNLRILGKATVGLLNYKTILQLPLLTGLKSGYTNIVVGLVMVLLVLGILSWLFFTEIGQALIASGDNAKMARALGINVNAMQIFGCMLANGLIGLAGGLIAQSNGYADVNMGSGTIVIGLAAIIIGEVVFGNLSLTARLFAVIIGSILYRFVLLAVLQLGFSSDDFRLVAAVVLTACLLSGQFKRKFRIKKLFKKAVGKLD